MLYNAVHFLYFLSGKDYLQNLYGPIIHINMEMMVERVSSDTSGQFTKFVHRDS
jgi:hypothetical protein